jgi:hypothetical protein
LSAAARSPAPFAVRRWRAVVRYRADGVPGELAVTIDLDRGGAMTVEEANADVALAVRVEPSGGPRAGAAILATVTATGEHASPCVVSSTVTARRDGIRLDLLEPSS